MWFEIKNRCLIGFWNPIFTEKGQLKLRNPMIWVNLK